MRKKYFNFFTTFCSDVVSLIEFRENTCFGMIRANSHRRKIHYVQTKA